MKPPRDGLRVGVVGASSLLGKELIALLKERRFPVQHLVAAESEEGEPDLPIVDLREGLDASMADEDLAEKDFDLVFVAAAPSAGSKKKSAAGEAPFLRSTEKLAAASRCIVIDMVGALPVRQAGEAEIPFLRAKSGEGKTAGHSVSPNPAAIILAALLLRLAARFPLQTAVAQVFDPVSDFGPKAVEELQHQTTSLLSFQKVPQKIFGQQLAFNVLPRLGRAHRKDSPGKEIQRQLREVVGDRAPVPALRLLQAPVFHSIAVSLYVETRESAALDDLTRALVGERIEFRRSTENPPSQVEASGSNVILVDAITADESSANGVWIWAVADNLRLAALNAVEIAEAHIGRKRGREASV